MLHAIHLAQSNSRLIVKCDDTDVLVLLVYYSSKGMFGSPAVFMHSGHGLKVKFVPVCLIAQKIGAAICECLPACHALTGCDTTAASVLVWSLDVCKPLAVEQIKVLWLWF